MLQSYDTARYPFLRMTDSSLHFVYLRGTPGSGKITSARIVGERLDYQLFWFHDIKNPIQAIVGNREIHRLMDAVTKPIIATLLEAGRSVIYVRPSPDRETVVGVRDLVLENPRYRWHLITLTASYEALKGRVTNRHDPNRIQDAAVLEQYIAKRPVCPFEDETIIDTTNLTPSEVSDRIISTVCPGFFSHL